ncbi:MAG: hypothetical protein EOP39_02205 [Rubrivivax sp.]|nr:MAG: hypothetical protein EOP39_02205 [Rubrivivax sp.]
MSDDTGSTAARGIVIGLLAIATLGFGLAGLCGMAFTFMALPDVLGSGQNGYAVAALVISVPSLLIGGGLAWVCARGLRKFLRRPQA